MDFKNQASEESTEKLLTNGKDVKLKHEFASSQFIDFEKR